MIWKPEIDPRKTRQTIVDGKKLIILKKLVKICNAKAKKNVFVGFFPRFNNHYQEYYILCVSFPVFYDNNLEKLFKMLEGINKEKLNIKFDMVYGKRYFDYKEEKGVFVR